MKLSDLETGMIVTWRNGTELVVMIDYECQSDIERRIFVNEKDRCWLRFGYYREDMKMMNGHTEFDIVKVELATHPYGFLNLEFEKENRKLLWSEEIVKEVTMAEVEEKFGCKIKIVKED